MAKKPEMITLLSGKLIWTKPDIFFGFKSRYTLQKPFGGIKIDANMYGQFKGFPL